MASDRKPGVLHLAAVTDSALIKRSPRAPKTGPKADGASAYYARIEQYAQMIRQTSDVGEIIAILDEALGQTRAMHTKNEVAEARAQVVAAEQRIEQLRAELALVGKLVREDQLTGALNRRGLDEALEREVARAERGETPLCAVLIDIDDLKNINDSHGHQVGDFTLVHVVAIIRETLRANDLIGRYGGDEFVLLLPNSSLDEASAVLTRLRTEIAAKPLAWGNEKLLVTFSAGIAERRKGQSVEALMQRIDQALYEAKRVGKDRVVAAD